MRERIVSIPVLLEIPLFYFKVAVSIRLGTLFYGMGIVVGGLAMYAVAFPRLYRYVRRIDYNIYCSQPVFNEISNDRWKAIAQRLETLAAHGKTN